MFCKLLYQFCRIKQPYLIKSVGEIVTQISSAVPYSCRQFEKSATYFARA